MCVSRLVSGGRGAGPDRTERQVNGSKLAVICSALEAARAWKTKSMQEIRALLGEIEAKNIPEQMLMPGFGAAVLRTGDVLHVPAGAIMIEKSINDMDVSIRLWCLLCLLCVL